MILILTNVITISLESKCFTFQLGQVISRMKSYKKYDVDVVIQYFIFTSKTQRKIENYSKIYQKLVLRGFSEEEKTKSTLSTIK